MNRTLSIIKPDATKRNITGAINKTIEDNNLIIVAQKMIKLSKEKAEGFYSVHKDRPFFNDLIEYMTSGPVIVHILIFSLVFLSIKTLTNFFKNNTNYAQNLSHLGFAMLMLSILFNSISSTEIIKNIKVGESFISKNEKITFQEIKTNEKKNYSSIVGTFEIKNNNNKIIKLYPEIRVYNQPIIATSEAAIKTTLFKDRFITINLIKDEQLFNVRYQNKPFMIWIWISTLIIIFGGTFAIFSKKKNYS